MENKEAFESAMTDKERVMHNALQDIRAICLEKLNNYGYTVSAHVIDKIAENGLKQAGLIS